MTKAGGNTRRAAGKKPPTPQAHVDYSLARKSVLRSYHGGRTSRFDICDAHTELIRAARNVGKLTDVVCPVCDQGPLILVSYLFTDELPKKENGQVWMGTDLAPLLKYREARVYTVEVCVDCSWNHVRSQVTVGHGRAPRARAKPRRAST